MQGTDFDSAISFHLVLGRTFFAPKPVRPLMLIDARYLDYFARLETVGRGEGEKVVAKR